MPPVPRLLLSSRSLPGAAHRTLLLLAMASVLPGCTDRATIDLFPTRVSGAAGSPNISEPINEPSNPASSNDSGLGGSGSTALDGSVSSSGATSSETTSSSDRALSDTDSSSNTDSLETVSSDTASSETASSDTAVSSTAVDDSTVPDSGPSLAIAPLHRYDFSGVGTEVVDLMGGSSGIALGGTVLDGSGQLALDGNDDYVELPTRLVSSLTDATFMSWSTWSPNRVNPCWDRVFSFGNAIAGPGTSLIGDSELFVTATGCTPEGNIMVRFQPDPNGLIGLAGSQPFPVDQERQVALVVDSLSSGALLYLEGDLIGGMLVPVVLAQLNDEDNWLGQSLWTQDFNWRGSLNEFRVYDVALNAEQIAMAHQLGPDDPGF